MQARTRYAPAVAGCGPGGDGSTPDARPCSWSPSCGRANIRELGCGFAVGASTVYRYVKEGMRARRSGPDARASHRVARGKAYAILDGRDLRIDRITMASGGGRPYYSGNTKPTVWVSPPLPGAPHDIAPAKTDTGNHRPQSAAQKGVNAAHARLRGPGERAYAELKS